MSSGAPLTSENLFEVLQAATSQSQELVQNASSQLKSWELVPGYWGMLQVCFVYYLLLENIIYTGERENEKEKRICTRAG